MKFTKEGNILVLFLISTLLYNVDCRHIQEISQTKQRDINCLKTNIDDYLDNVLKRASKELPDPMRLPPRSAVVDLKDGLTWGLSTLAKLGNAVVDCDGQNITLKIKLTVEELKGRYTWIKETRRRHREGYVTFMSKDFAADVIITIKKHNGEVVHPHLERLEIKKFKDVKVEITGMGLISWALGEITTLLSGVFQRTIASAVQSPLAEAIERQMRDINIA
ncbi:uncharacterized protein [Parasteatoda tepidariorum]|uniref:uncharacterized protein n=1 Tax=Parasteatoda tepidariorum TaxID=114398 RepID=UPI001C722900|nr:uncharacterized protein LOC107436249 [Parasteatoda tepidariorum]